jgi:GNAT superfamily N-acetyltransferase
VEIRRAIAEDGPALCGVLARAFTDDPFIRWFVGTSEGPRYRRYFEMIFERLTLPFGECYTTPAVEGAALWAPPGAWDLGVLDQLRLLPVVARVVGLGRLRQASRDAALIEQARPAAPYYYLALIGTAPERQGRGIASALLRPVLDRCDEEGVLAVLDTGLSHNVGFYERRGFEVVRVLPLPRGGPTLYTMVREPAQ